MGEGVFGHISKGPIHRKVDAVVNDQNGAGQYHRRAAFMASVTAAATADAYLAVLRQQAQVTQPEAIYLRDTWYNEGPLGLWPWLQPIYPVLRQGLIKAIQEATAANLPLDSYWAPASDQVEVIVARSAQQVTRVILTPSGPAPMSHRPNRAPVWIVRRGSVHETAGRETQDEFVETVDGNVVTVQMKDF